MSSKIIEIDIAEYQEFFERMSRLGRGILKKEFGIWLEALGTEFLRIVQDEIIRREVVDSRQLLISFYKNDEHNIWSLTEGNLELIVGSTLDYAAYVNNGHWTNPKGIETRFVPGYWSGDRFIYDPKAKGGMVLKQKWIDGNPYFDSAIQIMEKMLPGLFDAKFQQWFDNFLS